MRSQNRGFVYLHLQCKSVARLRLRHFDRGSALYFRSQWSGDMKFAKPSYRGPSVWVCLSGYVTSCAWSAASCEARVSSVKTTQESFHFLLLSPPSTTTPSISQVNFESIYQSTYHLSIQTMPGITSASGVLGFLFDEEPELKVFALQTLNEDIDTVWTEVAGAVGQM